MEAITLYLRYGTPGILLGLVVMVILLRQSVETLKESVDNIKQGVVWEDVCEGIHKGLDDTLRQMDKRINHD